MERADVMRRFQLRIQTLAVLCGCLQFGASVHGQAPTPDVQGGTLVDRIEEVRARSLETGIETAERSEIGRAHV